MNCKKLIMRVAGARITFVGKFYEHKSLKIMISYRFRSLLLLSLLWLSLPAWAQYTQTLRGVVIDALTEMPLPGATVIILGSDPLVGVTTDINGGFRFEEMPIGRVDIGVTMIGYKPAAIHNLLLSTGREMVVEIKLEEQVYQLEDVVIRPEQRKDQPMNEMALVSARSFTIEETERYAGSLGDPSRMASNFAGVSSPSDQRNDIVIRGNSPLGLLWRIDGIEVPNPNHFGSMGSTGGPISMLNNNLLTNSDFYTGAFPAEFGNALAGAFDLRMRNGNNEKREYLGQVGFNGFELGAEGPISRKTKSSYLVNFRYSTLDVLKSLGMSFGTGAAVPEYHDLSFKLNFPLKKGRLSVFGIGGSSYIEMLDSEGDDAQYGFSGTDLYFGARMGVIGITHVHYITNDARLTTTIAASGLENSTDIFDLGVDPDTESIIERDYEVKYTLSSKYSQRINVKNFINVGATYDFYDVMYRGREYSSRFSSYFYYMNTKGNLSFARAFGEWQHRFNNRLTLTSGLHTTYLFLNESYGIEPRLALKWNFTEMESVSLGFGLHSQSQLKAVYFMEELVDTVNLVYRKSNEGLDFSKSIHVVAGYDRLLGEQHRLKAEVYYQRLYNIPVAQRRPEYSMLSQGAGFVFWAYHDLANEGTGENKGIELTLEKFLQQGFYYLFTASVFDAGYRGYDGVWRNSAFNNNFVFNLLGGYEWRLGERSFLSLDGKLVWAGGNRFIPILEAQSVIQGEAVYDWDNIYTERYPDYFRLNARITYRLNGKNVNQEWALDLQNVTNHQNIFVENWDSQKKEVSRAYQMGFMPMMTYRIYF